VAVAPSPQIICEPCTFHEWLGIEVSNPVSCRQVDFESPKASETMGLITTVNPVGQIPDAFRLDGVRIGSNTSRAKVASTGEQPDAIRCIAGPLLRR